MHRARKSLGQHFLIDNSVIQRIVGALTVRAQDTYVEIGPGLGALTRHILPLVPALTVIEYDKTIIPLLEKECMGLGNLIVKQADVLTVDFNAFANGPLHIIGNLPYNISTPILFHLTHYSARIADMVLMLQKEVVDRLVAKPHTKAYGRLSVMIQCYYEVEDLFIVPPTAFSPPPKVHSAVVRLIPKQDVCHTDLDLILFAHIVNIAFQQRRKTIRNSLQALFDEASLQSLGLDIKARAENLTLENYQMLTRYLQQHRENACF